MYNILTDIGVGVGTCSYRVLTDSYMCWGGGGGGGGDGMVSGCMHRLLGRLVGTW